jgi:hypothetical protein
MTPVIDYWLNLFTPKAVKHLWEGEMKSSPSGKVGAARKAIKGRTPAQMVAWLDTLGVERAIVPAVRQMSYQTKQRTWNIKNEEVAEIVQAFPDRFTGLAGIDPYLRMDGVREMEHAIREYGFRGAVLFPYGFGLPVNDAHLYPFYAKLEELGATLVVQIGHTLAYAPIHTMQPKHLDEVALYFPGLRIVASHTGWPWSEELVAVSWKHPNVYIGTAMHMPRYWDPAIIKYLNGRGKDKVVFGSGDPGIPLDEALQSVEQDLSELIKPELLPKLMHDNAVAAFGL